MWLELQREKNNSLGSVMTRELQNFIAVEYVKGSMLWH